MLFRRPRSPEVARSRRSRLDGQRRFPFWCVVCPAPVFYRSIRFCVCVCVYTHGSLHFFGFFCEILLRWIVSLSPLSYSITFSASEMTWVIGLLFYIFSFFKARLQRGSVYNGRTYIRNIYPSLFLCGSREYIFLFTLRRKEEKKRKKRIGERERDYVFFFGGV